MIRYSTGWGSSQSDPRREPSSEPRQHGSPRTTIRTKVPHGLAPHATWRIGRVGTWNGDRRGIPWSSPLPVPGPLHGQSRGRFLTVKGFVCAHAQNFAKVQLVDSGVLGFHGVHESSLIFKSIEKQGLL